MNEGSLNYRFIFDWRKTPWDYRLPVLIGISLVGHILSFYIFHIVYPATTSLLPPAAQISVLDPENPQDQQILAWIEVNDPASVSVPSFRPRLIAQLTPRYRPSFSTVSPQLLPLTLKGPKAQGLPSLFSPENLSPIRSQPIREGQTRTFPTRVEVSPTLKPRLRNLSPSFPTTSKLVEPSSFFVGVNRDGTVDFVFLWTSSGDNELDQTADRFVRTLKFDPAESAAWGTVRLCWGVDGRTEGETGAPSED
jgi:hypothetical protein